MTFRNSSASGERGRPRFETMPSWRFTLGLFKGMILQAHQDEGILDQQFGVEVPVMGRHNGDVELS